MNQLANGRALKYNHESVANSARPDFLFFGHDFSFTSSLYASFVVELMLNKYNPAKPDKEGTLDNQHKGKVCKYNLNILNYNKRREFVVSAVTDLMNIVFIKSEKNSIDPKPNQSQTDETQVFHTCSRKFKFWEEGVKLLKIFLDNPYLAGFDEKLLFYLEIRNK